MALGRYSNIAFFGAAAMFLPSPCKSGLSFVAMLLASAFSCADSVVDFRVESGKSTSVQPVLIKQGVVLVKAAGGDPNLDILYEKSRERLVLIDHKKQVFTVVTDEKVVKIAQLAEDVQPLLQGLGEQLKKLSPKQRAKWEDMLGGISLDRFDEAKRAAQSTKLMKTGISKTVAGISCQEMDVVRRGTRAAEFCLADPGALKLPGDDAATLQSLVAFTQRLASRAEGLGSQFGIELPVGSLASLAGVPVEMREIGGKRPVALTLSGVSDQGFPPDSLEVPAGYRPKELSLW